MEDGSVRFGKQFSEIYGFEEAIRLCSRVITITALYIFASLISELIHGGRGGARGGLGGALAPPGLAIAPP